jgi:hypothetical protein
MTWLYVFKGELKEIMVARARPLLVRCGLTGPLLAISPG